MLPSDSWRRLSERIEKTKVTFPKLTLPCEDALQSMLDMAKKLQDNLR